MDSLKASLKENLKARFPEFEALPAAKPKGEAGGAGAKPSGLSLVGPARSLPALLTALKEDFSFDFLMSVSGVESLPDVKAPRRRQAAAASAAAADSAPQESQSASQSAGQSGAPLRSAPLCSAPLRFEAVYELFSSRSFDRLRVKIPVREGEEIPTAQFIYPAADWFEREAYDMFGMVFSGHPNLKRILTHHQFKGWPLRKGYPADRQQHLTEPLPFQMDREPDGSLHKASEDLQPLNIGPSHPATHGTLRIMALMNGERIEKANVEIGYLHRCFEKMAEEHPYNQIIPYTDRLNYCSSPMNNVGYCRAVEELMGIEIPPKAQTMRVILCELSRIIDHIVCIGAAAFDLGALTGFFHLFAYREKVYTLFEKLCGARLTVSMTRIGGMANRPPKGWFKDILLFCREMRKGIDDLDTLLSNNKIWIQRNKGVGAISAERAIAWGYTGPCLRSAGLNLDLRKAEPYYGYEGFDFEIPVGSTGDAYDRYLVRVEEMRQSLRIIEQAAKNVPSGDHTVRDRNIALPEKKDVYGNIEGLMQHFMLIINGLRPPRGEIYSATEAANGELGFYLVSDGGPRPWRLKVRPPCFPIYQSFAKEAEGGLVADAVTLLGSMNIIAGELDR